jgi:hypothetical protein
VESYQVLDPFHKRLVLDGTQYKPYVINYYRLYILTCFYLTAVYDSQGALDKSQYFIDYFLKIIKLTERNKIGPQPI